MRGKCPNSVLCWHVFSRVRTEYRDLLTGKYGPEKTPNSDIFQAVVLSAIDA